MNSYSITSAETSNIDIATDQVSKPSVGRRIALAVTGFLACALPIVFTLNISRMLFTGVEGDHQFHQVTGQGLVLMALWLGSVVPLLVAGWKGRRPSSLTGLLHLTFMVTGAVCAALSPGGGAPVLMGVIVVTGALVWAVLPTRPVLRSRLQVDPLLAPVALLTAALFTPYMIDQIGLQNAATTGYHSQNPHFFDMAWMVLTLTVLSFLSALLVSVRRLILWVAGASFVIGAAGLAFGEGVVWSGLVAGLGLAATAAALLHQRIGWDR